MVVGLSQKVKPRASEIDAVLLMAHARPLPSSRARTDWLFDGGIIIFA
jgi:hypothetical protein